MLTASCSILNTYTLNQHRSVYSVENVRVEEWIEHKTDFAI